MRHAPSRGTARALFSLSFIAALAACATLAVTTPVAAQSTEVVAEFEPRPADDADLVPGVWYDWYTEGDGAASIVDLTDAGGDLENEQPLPSGAAFLSTEASNGDRANVGLYDALGTAGDVFPTLEIDYEFLKASSPVPSHNLNAAAAIKMEIFNPDCHDPAMGVDCYGTLIYEPYVNGFGNHPLVDVWHQAEIRPDSGGFWWTGGFGQPNSGAAPPYRTLETWLDMMSPDFQDATIVSFQVGVGSYNQGQRAYFDEVAIRHSAGMGLDVVYDFQPLLPVAVDVRPNNSRNQVNTNAKQLVPVAILGTEDFDPVAELDIASVMARGTPPIATRSDEDDIDGDGFRDFTVYFRARQLEKPSEAECSNPDAKLEVTGVTFSGDPFSGVDFVEWQGPDCSF